MMTTNITSIAQRPIIQICWKVDNMEAAARQWSALMGAGPFFLVPHIQFDDLIDRGKPATLDQSSAVGQWGSVQVELFEQHCDSPSILRDMFAPGSTGLQHMTWVADDLDSETRRMEGLGFPRVWSCKLRESGMRIAMFDTRPVLGALSEVYEENASIRQFYRAIAQAAKGWKGEDPVRSIGDLVLS